MDRIVAPIRRNDRGPVVHNLQSALLLLLGANQPTPLPAARKSLLERLFAEQRGDAYGEATMQAVAAFQKEHSRSSGIGLDTGEEVDDSTAAAINQQLDAAGTVIREPEDPFRIEGRVEFEDGVPAAGLRVDAFDRDLGVHRALLGDPQHPVITDERGAFSPIEYRAADVAEGEGRAGPQGDIVFEITGANMRPLDIVSLHRITDAGSHQTEADVPDLVLGFEAAPRENVRIVIAGRPTEDGLAEYGRLMRDLAPLLLVNVTPADFDEARFRDVEFAARETGWDRALIATMSVAWQLARAASREPRPLAETIYGLLRDGPPTEVPPLEPTLDGLIDGHSRWAIKLQDSIAHRIIDGALDDHLVRLRALRTEAVARSSGERRGSIGDVLVYAKLSDSDRRGLLDAYHANDGSTEDFWTTVVPQLGWASEKISAVQESLQLADVLSYDMPLMAELAKAGVAQVRDLVTLDRASLVATLTRLGPQPDAPGDTADEQIARTADAITTVADATYPTESIAHLAATSTDQDLAAARDLLSRFFDQECGDKGHGSFDLSTVPVTSYLETNARRIFDGMSSDSQALLTSQLQRLQRVFRLGVDRAQTESLLELGLDSAFHITRFSPEHFISEFGDRIGGVDKASTTYARAEKIAGTVLYMYADLWDGVQGIKPMSIMSTTSPEQIPALKDLPSYRALFGDTQLCACGDCQSFYSPAAYFIDLLHMLDRSKLGAANPVEVLFNRRPDLAQIQLTCENTNTLIPYIDLVTEILESFVANRAPTPFNVPPAPPNRKLPAPTAEELRVNPVYITAASAAFADTAYAALQDAVFPITLPLNLPLETTRAYLGNLGVAREDLMALLDLDPGLEAVMARATEIVVLSPEEFELLTGATFGGASAGHPATTAELFGLSIAGGTAAKTMFNHGAPEFAFSATTPDPRGALISSLQNVLGILSATPVPVTGVYDAATVAAVNAFLTKHGLPASGVTDSAFWGAMEGDDMPSLSVLLCPVPMFLDRSGVTYEDLVTLVQTRFLNPQLQGDGDFDYLTRLGIPAADVRAWIVAGLGAIPAAIQTVLTATGEDPTVFTTWVTRRKRAIVINDAFDAPCDLARATLLHLDGTLLTLDELVTLFRFVRLWRAVGWSIAELDDAITPGALEDANAFSTILLLSNVKQLHDKLEAAIPELVTLWSSIPTHGIGSLYDRLFRNRAAQLVDPILALDRDRTELAAVGSATPPAISDHVGPLLAALRVGAQDMDRLRAALGLADDPSLPPSARPPLTLATLSAIYREVWLARTLGLSVREMLALVDLSGLAVFQLPNSVPRGDALAFVDLVGKVSSSGVNVGLLEYLCRATPQPPGLPATQQGVWRRTIATIVDGLRAIASEEPIKDDPTGEELTARLTALIGIDDARAMTALIYGRDVYTALLGGLPATFVFPASLAGRTSYDAALKQLRIAGAVTSGDLATLLSAPGVPAAILSTYQSAVKALDVQARAFVARALKTLFTPAEAEAALIDIASLDAKGHPIVAVIDVKIADVLARRQLLLSRSLIKQTVITATGLTADIVGLLLENAAVLTSLSGAGPAMGDYQDIQGDGLDAEYFSNPDLTVPSVLQRIDQTPDFELKGAIPGPGVPAVNFSVRWTGSLYVPAAGEVTFRIRCTDGVQLLVNGAIVIDEWKNQVDTEFNAIARLDGGQFYEFELHYYNKTGGALLELSWSSPAIPLAVIPQSAFYSSARLTSLLQRIERLYKVPQLLAPFSLTARDLQLLAEHGDIDLDVMPLVEPAAPSSSRAMFAQWITLFDFAALRNQYPSSESSVMEVPTAPSDQEALARFVTLTGVAPDTLDDLLEALTVRVFDSVLLTWSSAAPDLGRLSSWQRMASALAFVQQTGASPDQLLAWARAREISELATGPATHWFTWTAIDASGIDRSADNKKLAQAAKNLVRSHYDETQWRDQAQALNDTLRARRRSALTAYVLTMPEMMRARVSDANRLYEYLLIDVEMEPCMETSRIKQGISSVQQFVQRVLLNIELLVLPSVIDRARWEWTKNYRVWEANRKVFLYPESYMLEELRDDKSQIYTELESELLQDDLTEATAEQATRHYLEKLDVLAKLIVCGTSLDDDAGVLHVFARTATTPFVFYHRRLDNPDGLSWTEGVWSPWEKLPVDVETVVDGNDSGTHLLPITWNRRLFLFWPLFEQKPQERDNAQLPQGFDRINCWHIRLAWSEYKEGQWSPKETGVPFVVSNSAVIVKKTPGTYPDTESYHNGPFGPGTIVHPGVHIHNSGVLVDLGLIPADVDIPSSTDYLPRTLTTADDPLLNGVVLKAAGDLAEHDHHVDIINVSTFFPKPASHYLDASIVGSQLSIRVFCRFKGTATGQATAVTTDKISIVQDGKRADRKEQSTDNYRITDLLPSAFNHVGTFHFPACAAELDAESSTDTFPFESLARPEYTINSFMMLRNDWPGGTGLRFAKGASPILGFVPTPFDLIDSDDVSGFNRSSPFFYQDQRRCYLVTREGYAREYGPRSNVAPDTMTMLAGRAESLTALRTRQIGVAVDSPMRTNPWAQAATEQWGAGPGVPFNLQPPPGALPALSGTISAKNDRDLYALKGVIAGYGQVVRRPEYTFTPAWHPYTCPLIASLNVGGLPRLYTLPNESLTDARLLFAGVIGGPMPIIITNNFETIYKPDPAQVVQPYPFETVDFARSGAYAGYNWELFFHMPMMMADAYCRAGQHEQGLRCIQRVYDPMFGEGDMTAVRVWRFLPFRTTDPSRIEETIGLLSYTGTDATKLKDKANLEASIKEWLDNPFNPHLIARRRPVVYMKYVFMKYLDCLIEWADQLFQQDTMESINEATQLYVLAADLLGPRPVDVPTPGPVAPETFQTLRARLDSLSNAQVDLETRLPFTALFGAPSGASGSLTQLPQALYFCLPQNDRMLAYWDTVADRLFKIRHCMSFDGTARQLPLFDSPIDPMLLVEAVAHGLDIGSVLNDLYAPLPRYRFTFMLQQALSLCNEVRTMGNTLLSVLEKGDGEALTRMRATQETELLGVVKASKKLQIDEADQASQALEVTSQVTASRRDYYDNLITLGLSSEELDQLGQLDLSNEEQETAGWLEATAHALNLIPNVTIGGESSGTTFGGSNLGAATSAVARGFAGQSASHAYRASRSSITGGHARRMDDWRFQRDQAKRELTQIDRQLTASRIRKAIAEADLRSHETSIDHSRSVEEQLRTKFTNDGLWGWMQGELRAIYFQCYKTAYEVAKAAERTWQYAVGADATFIGFGAWDSSVRGLLAGERLYVQLKQMERAYLNQQVREFEIAKDVSIAQLNPLALIALKETGTCEVDIPEWLFNIDYPDHYFRRLKSVSVSIPAIVGRSTSLSATLTLLSSKVRESSRIAGAYGDDENYRSDHLAVEAIAASSAQMDSGRFQLDFRDDKYLPFEGAGAISRWRLELPKRFRSLDYDAISDVFLHLRLTSRRDETLAEPALDALQTMLDGMGTGTLFHLFSLRHDFPNQWQTLRLPTRAATFTITKDRLPLLVQPGAVTVSEIHASLILKDPRPAATYKATLIPGATAALPLQWNGTPGRYRPTSSTTTIPITLPAADNGWQLQLGASMTSADLDAVKDILIAVRYSVKF